MMSQNNKVVNSFFDPSFEEGKSKEEFSKNYNGNKNLSKYSNEEQLLRRWFFKFVGIPNAVGSRVREWLKETPGSGGSTIDKSAGTHTFEKTRIRKTERIQKSDGKYHREYSRARENERKKNRASNYRRSQKNHHVYHVYKQNETKIQNYVDEQENFRFPRAEYFTSNSVLVLPRNEPKSGDEISYTTNSKTRTEKKLIT